MSRIAFLTMDSLDGFVSYDYLVRDILRQRGLRVDEVSWKNPHADWDQYDLVVIRSPWDYQQSCSQFLDVLALIDASRANLQNPLKVVRWNVEKTYLRDLQDSGVTIVPTAWLQSPRVDDLTNLFHQLNVIISLTYLTKTSHFKNPFLSLHLEQLPECSSTSVPFKHLILIPWQKNSLLGSKNFHSMKIY